MFSKQNKQLRRKKKKKIGMWSLGDEMVSPAEFKIEQKRYQKRQLVPI